ncbi:hypothetical protein D3C73_1508180 [compost metagenome]
MVSTTPSRLNGTTRRPLISTSVRLVPRPRRLMVAPPPEPLLVAEPTAGTAAGRSLTSSSTATGCDMAMVSELIDVMGLDAS